MSEENAKEEMNIEDGSSKSKDKKMQNLIALSILLGGLFVGSVFVDVVQLIRGEGFSVRKLKQADVVEAGDKTWVAYPDPIVNVDVITADDCEACKTDDVLVWLRRVLPTVSATKVDKDSEVGKKMVSDFNIKSIPSFVFTSAVEKTEFFQKAGTVFGKKNEKYLLNNAELGIPVGKFIELPVIGEGDVKIGNPEAKVKIVEFSDFQCPYCKVLHESLKKAIAEYGDKILFVFKNFPLSFHQQAENASLAAACANEQGKFLEYGNRLFDRQADWGKGTGVQMFKNYARDLRLNTAQFNKCLDDKKYADKINQDLEEGKSFGISGTPAIFINGDFRNGAIDYNTLKGIIDAELAK